MRVKLAIKVPQWRYGALELDPINCKVEWEMRTNLIFVELSCFMNDHVEDDAIASFVEGCYNEDVAYDKAFIRVEADPLGEETPYQCFGDSHGLFSQWDALFYWAYRTLEIFQTAGLIGRSGHERAYRFLKWLGQAVDGDDPFVVTRGLMRVALPIVEDSWRAPDGWWFS